MLFRSDTLYYAYNIGMICVATNYRGCGNSEGTDEFGGDDVDDVTKIVDLCEEFDYIDNSKMLIRMEILFILSILTYGIQQKAESML